MSLYPTLILTPQAMARVDALTIANSVSGFTLMQAAGSAVARVCSSLQGPGTVRVLCGPGNNGGDGYVVAAMLCEMGWSVALLSLCETHQLQGDAALAAQACPVDVLNVGAIDDGAVFDTVDVFIDAAFGAGLKRPLRDADADVLARCHHAAKQTIAIDLPSGIDGGTGADLSGLYEGEDAIVADHCVTFGAKKFGHVLYPGAAGYKQLWVADIGLDSDAIRYQASAEHLGDAWLDAHRPRPSRTGHKYKRGHVGVLSGEANKAGAARLSAHAALRAGAGLVTVLCRGDAAAHAGVPAAIMHAQHVCAFSLKEVVEGRKISALVIGPGFGLSDSEAEFVKAAMSLDIPIVFDADALTLMARKNLLDCLQPQHIITPHQGEFDRLFASVDGTKRERFEDALALSRATIVLKGADTLIGQRLQRGRTSSPAMSVINHGSSFLATAGSGDVLAGIIAAFASRPGAQSYQAAQLGALLHARTAHGQKKPFIADDLVGGLAGA